MLRPIQMKANIRGRVQGVFFRVHTRNEAQRLGLTGWVKNCPDGSVETVFEGQRDQVTQMLTWLQTGPPLSRVDRVISSEMDGISGFSEFKIIY